MMRFAWITVLAALGAAIACGTLVGVPGSEIQGVAALDAGMDADAALDAPDEPAPVCYLDAAMGNVCHECRNENCCGVFLACHDSTACGDYIDCVTACSTTSSTTCTYTCIEKNPSGHAIAAPYVACASVHCPGPCGEADAGICLLCQEANCPTEELNCFSDPACDTLRYCLEACGAGNDKCLQGCKNAASTATQDLYNALFSCGITYCTTACS